MENLQIGNTKVDYELQQTGRKKTIELIIDLKKGFTVRAPKHMTKEQIINNLHKKSKWIINNLDKMTDVLKYDSNKEYISGEKYLYLGRRYKLKVLKANELSHPILSFTNSVFVVKMPKDIVEIDYPKHIRPLFVEFYKQTADFHIKLSVLKYIKHFKHKTKAIRVVSLKNKWGSCSQGNQVLYNWRIAMAKPYIFDYIILHELCHLDFKDHSKSFWNKLKSIMPDYEKRKEWLRINSDLLNL